MIAAGTPPRWTHRVRGGAAAAAVLAMVLSGCGHKPAPVKGLMHEGTTTMSPDGVQQITMTASVDKRFYPSVVHAHPGRIRVLITVPVGASHDFVVLQFPGTETGEIITGETRTVEFTLPAPGEYPFRCLRHADLGMGGTIIVS